MIEIFKSTDSQSEIIEALEDNNIVCVHGSRVSTRKTLRNVVSELNKFDDEEKFINLSHNHPDTELGYAFNHQVFDLNEALKMVIDAYEKSNV